MKPEEFEERWQKTENEPEVKEADVEKVELDLSMTGLLANFEKIAEKSKERGELDESAYKELIDRTEKLKKLVTKVEADDLVKREWHKRVQTKMENMMKRFRSQ